MPKKKTVRKKSPAKSTVKKSPKKAPAGPELTTEGRFKPIGTDPESLAKSAGFPDDFVILGVMVSWNYHGELAIVLPRAMEVLDRLFVVTDVDDTQTQNMVRAAGAELILTRNFRRNGAAFNKGEAVHIAQKRAHDLAPFGWVLVFDSDIVLPRSLRETVLEEAVDELAIYGMERMDFSTPEAYAAHEPDGMYRHRCAGYFQLYKRKDFLYPPFSENASRCDISFMRKFPRVCMLSGYCEHLGTKAVNWNGRVAPEWKQPEGSSGET